MRLKLLLISLSLFLLFGCANKQPHDQAQADEVEKKEVVLEQEEAGQAESTSETHDANEPDDKSDQKAKSKKKTITYKGDWLDSVILGLDLWWLLR